MYVLILFDITYDVYVLRFLEWRKDMEAKQPKDSVGDFLG